MKPSKGRSLEILKCLEKGTSINMILRYGSFTEKEVRTVLRKNYFETDINYTEKWKKMKVIREKLTFSKLKVRKLNNREIEEIFLRRLQGEKYASIEADYEGISKGYVGNLCHTKPTRVLSKKLKLLWEQIQVNRTDLDNRYIF